MANLIHRLCFELRARGRAEARHAMREAEAAVESDTFLAALNEALDQAAPGEHVLIDRLEIDLGRIAARRVGDALVPAIKARLAGHHVSGSRLHGLPEGWPASSARPDEDQGSAPSVRTLDVAEAFFHWLEHGTRPWWVSGEDWAQLRVQWAGETVLARLLPRLESLIQTRPALVWRLLSCVELCLALPVPSSWPTVESKGAAGTALREAASSLFSSPPSEFRLPQHEMPGLTQTGGHPSAAMTVRAAARLVVWLQSRAPSWRLPGPMFDQGAKDSGAFRAALTDWVAKVTNGARRASSSSPEQVPNLDARSPAVSKEAQPRAGRSIDPAEGKGIPIEHGVPVLNGGLVLLHPFLPRFLAALGLALTGGQIPAALRMRAAMALHWLVWGRRAVDDSELVLEKWLCGLMPADAVPLPDTDELDPPAVTAEAEALLAAVIAHWRTLGSTSPAGLREAFLQRPALLHLDGEGSPRLCVEPRSYDLLLRRLPWTVNPVRLPWLVAPLRIEWEGAS